MISALFSRSRMIVIALLLCHLQGIIAQQVQTQPASAGPPLGIWEMSIDRGAVGINIYRYGSARDWNIGVYQRTKDELTCGEENFFTTKPEFQSERTKTFVSDRLLTIHFSGIRRHPNIDLNLAFDPNANVWKGRFHRGQFDQEVILVRAHRTGYDAELCSK